MNDNDSRDDYYRRKEARQYIGGAGVIRLLLGGAIFIATIMHKESLDPFALYGWSALSIALITFGLKAYITAIKTGFRL
jgi:hypothetical protein